MMTTRQKFSLADLEKVVRLALSEKDGRTAIRACEEINTRFSDQAIGWQLAADVFLQLGNHARALERLDQALLLSPDRYDWQIKRARLLLSSGNIGAAKEQAEALVDKDFPSVHDYSDLALVLSDMECYQEALQQNRRALQLAPRDALLYYNQATLQRFLGAFGDAEYSLDEAIKLDPDIIDAYSLRSELRRQTVDKNHVDQLQKILAKSGLTPKSKVQLNYALAKELDDLGDREQSFKYLSQGAETRRKHMRYQVHKDLEVMQNIRQLYPASRFNGAIRGDNCEEPIFLLGLPRTGSTLLERILSSHSAVYSAGELNNFALQLVSMCQKNTGGGKSSPADLVAQSTQLDFARLGRAYVDSTRPKTGHTQHFIDKLPLNFLYAGLIHLALPRARIIHITRNPMDTCYAIFKQLFTNAYPFSYSLDDLGQYFIAYHQLMAHWEKVLPGVIHTVRYENLVADVEATTHSVLAYLNLPFEEQCLRFYDSKTASTTASAAQVRQPVYASSVDKWRQYEAQLRPLSDLLSESGII